MALISRRARPRKITNGSTQPLVVSSLSAPGMAAAHAEIPPEKWGKKIGNTTSRKDWQKEAWERMEDVGELRFAVQWKKALVSRFRLVASDLDPDTGRPTGATTNTAAQDIVRRIAGGTAGQAQLIGRFTVLLSVPGEGWLAIIYREVEDGAGIKRVEEQWHVLSTEEIENKGSTTTILLQDGSKHEMNPETDTLSRIWDPNPRRTWEADSAVRSALPTLREIVRMGQNIEGAGKSRQAGNGLLVLPEEISMPPRQAPTGAVDPDAPALPEPPQPPVQYVTTEQIREALQAAMAQAIENPASAEALVPILLQTKGEWIDKIRHIKFDSQVQEQSITTREKAIRRLALALDMPSEVLLGLADLNHWSLWGIEDEALRWHSAPLMETICDGLTEHLLRPMLERDGIDADNVVVWYDQTDVESDPEHDEKVRKAYELGLISSEAYARELDLQEEDVYDLTTLEGWGKWAADAVRKNPEHLSILAPILRATLPVLELPETTPEPEPPAIEPPPDTEEIPSEGPPDTRSQSVMVRMCLNQAVTLAAKRRHNRSNHAELKDLSAAQTHAKLGPVAADDVDRLIDGWDELLDPLAVQDAGVDQGRLRAVVRQCALATLTSGMSTPVVTPAQILWVRA